MTVNYQIDHIQADDDDNTFTLEPGSDYARPDNANRFIAGTDFTSVAGTVSWAANDNTPKYIQIPITQDQVVKFNRDLLIQLYYPSA